MRVSNGSVDNDKLTQQDVNTRRQRRVTAVNIGIAGAIAVAIAWLAHSGRTPPAFTDRIVWGVMFACVVLCAVFQRREVQTGRGNRTFLRALGAFAVMVGLNLISQFFEGGVKVGLLVATGIAAIPAGWLMMRAVIEIRAENAD